MQHVAGFRHLQDLNLSFKDVSLRFLDPLFELKELTSLQLDSPNLQSRHGAAATAIYEQATRLKASVLESARRVGVTAEVKNWLVWVIMRVPAQILYGYGVIHRFWDGRFQQGGPGCISFGIMHVVP